MCTDLQNRVTTFLTKLDQFEKTLPVDERPKVETHTELETRLIPFATDPLIVIREKGYKSEIIDFKTLLHLYKFYHQWITRLIIHRLGKEEINKKFPEFMLAINFVIARYLLTFMYQSRLQEGFPGFKEEDCDRFLNTMRLQLLIEHIFFKLKLTEIPYSFDEFRNELSKVIGTKQANQISEKDVEIYKDKLHVSLSFDDLEQIISKVYRCMPNKVLHPDLKSLGHMLLAKTENRNSDNKEIMCLADLLTGHMVLPSPSYDMLFRYVTCQYCKDDDFDDDPEDLIITF